MVSSPGGAPPELTPLQIGLGNVKISDKIVLFEMINTFSCDINFCRNTPCFSESATVSQNQIGCPSVY